MNRTWVKIGRTLYWLTWPGIFLSLYFSKRTRVLVVADEEVLLGKTWLGSGNWHAIGGGLRRSEPAADGALREVYEETGIRASREDIKELTTKRVTMENKLIVHYVGFVLVLDKKPNIQRKKQELTDLRWFALDEVVKDRIGGKTVADLLSAWQATL